MLLFGAAVAQSWTEGQQIKPLILHLGHGSYQNRGGSRSTVVVHWTAGQHIERFILHLGHGSDQIEGHP